MAALQMAAGNRSVNLALKTLIAIERAIVADQGSSYRGWLGQVMPHMGDAFRTGEDGFRSHMGASLIAGECARDIWYGFNWAVKPKFNATTLRLFNRGHLEEARFIACLLMIGCEVYQQDAQGKQFRISEMGGHYGGSGDGVAKNIPDLPFGSFALCEFKTHGTKSFNELAGTDYRKYWNYVCNPGLPRQEFTGKGVREAKFEHYVQMQQYMRKMGLPAALYMAVHKDTDLLYAEIVLLDEEVADQYLERAHKLVPMRVPPKRMSEDPSFYKCRWCDARGVCHDGAQPERNCRTCKWSRPDTNTGLWMCDNKDRQLQLLFPATNPLGEDFSLTKERQLQGCEHYELNPSFR